MAKIAFGMIALNARPLIEYNLPALYPFAHQIIVVEGATRSAASLADAKGHSLDGTHTWLRDFKSQNDPENKLLIVSAKDEGFSDGLWPEKDEMSQAYAKRASGDWLWQVDSDEFYKPKDMMHIISILDRQPDLNGVSFPFIEFWGSFDYITNGTWYLQEFTAVPRVFRWGKDFTYTNHRPPQVADNRGVVLDHRRFLKGNALKRTGIFMYHYSYVFPKQTLQKVGYYTNVGWTDMFRKNAGWLQESYFGLKRPMFLGDRKHSALQWLERFKGTHPDAIGELQADLAAGHISEALRPTDDIERLLSSRLYAVERALARAFLAVFWPLRTFWKRIRAVIFPAQAI